MDVAPAPNHVLFEAPEITYTPWSPGGKVEGYVAAGWEPVKVSPEKSLCILALHVPTVVLPCRVVLCAACVSTSSLVPSRGWRLGQWSGGF